MKVTGLLLRLLFSDKNFYLFIEKIISYEILKEELDMKYYIEKNEKTLTLKDLSIDFDFLDLI